MHKIPDISDKDFNDALERVAKRKASKEEYSPRQKLSREMKIEKLKTLSYRKNA